LATVLCAQVVKVDPDAGEVTVRNTETGKERVDKFDEIVLSPGAKPIVPPFPGKDLPGIFTVRYTIAAPMLGHFSYEATKHCCIERWRNT
jgi:NADPH-dependent 2,4-dienoyl-CoA reductase/sulfur reductase-like enzyme